MEQFLEQLRLIQETELTLDISKEEFTSLLSKNTDPLKSDLFEAFSTGKNKYKGLISEEGFILRRKKKFFQSKSANVKITGSINQEVKPIKLHLRLNGWTVASTLLYGCFLICYIFAFSVIIESDQFQSNQVKWILILVLTLHMILLLSAPVILLRKSVNRMSVLIIADLKEMVRVYHKNQIYRKN